MTYKKMKLPVGIFQTKALGVLKSIGFGVSVTVVGIITFEKYTNKQAEITRQIVKQEFTPVIVKLDSFQRSQNRTNCMLVDKLQSFDTSIYKDNRALRNENFKLWRENLNLKDEKKNVILSMLSML